MSEDKKKGFLDSIIERFSNELKRQVFQPLTNEVMKVFKQALRRMLVIIIINMVGLIFLLCGLIFLFIGVILYLQNFMPTFLSWGLGGIMILLAGLVILLASRKL